MNPTQRDIRRLAMQLLYQFDVRSIDDADAVRDGLNTGPDKPDIQTAAFELAMAAWESHLQADHIFAELAPQWPTHRQPPVDRAILRLAYHEITSGRTPVKSTINEAIELAKRFGSKDSSAFINGVLDKMAKRHNVEHDQAAP